MKDERNGNNAEKLSISDANEVAGGAAVGPMSVFCPKCNTLMKRGGITKQGRVWTCPNCGEVVYE